MRLLQRPEGDERGPETSDAGCGAALESSARAFARDSHGLGFWMVAAAFSMAMALSGAPAPLYTLYEKRDGFAPVMVTVIFAVYAIAVVSGLLLAGHISDWLGRKRVLVRAFAVQVLAALVFLAWPSLPGLFVARFLTGIAVGIISATATTHLLELHAVHRPHASHNRFEVVAAVANVGGIGLGSVIAGVVAQLFPAPLRLPWAVFTLLLLGCMLAVALAPETVEIPLERPIYRPQKVSLGHGDAFSYTAAIVGAITAMAIFALFASLAPGFVSGPLHHPSHAVAGAAVFVVFVAGACAQVLSGYLSPAARFRTGASAEAVGLIGLALAMRYPDLATFLASGAVAVAGGGILFKSGVGLVASLAPPSARGEAMAGFYLLAYLGLIGPIVGIGIATQYLTAATSVAWFAVLLLCMLAAVSVLQRIGSKRDMRSTSLRTT